MASSFPPQRLPLPLRRSLLRHQSQRLPRPPSSSWRTLPVAFMSLFQLTTRCSRKRDKMVRCTGRAGPGTSGPALRSTRRPLAMTATLLDLIDLCSLAEAFLRLILTFTHTWSLLSTKADLKAWGIVERRRGGISLRSDTRIAYSAKEDRFYTELEFSLACAYVGRH